jgi:hypothetical protein
MPRIDDDASLTDRLSCLQFKLSLRIEQVISGCRTSIEASRVLVLPPSSLPNHSHFLTLLLSLCLSRPHLPRKPIFPPLPPYLPLPPTPLLSAARWTRCSTTSGGARPSSTTAAPPCPTRGSDVRSCRAGLPVWSVLVTNIRGCPSPFPFPFIHDRDHIPKWSFAGEGSNPRICFSLQNEMGGVAPQPAESNVRTGNRGGRPLRRYSPRRMVLSRVWRQRPGRDLAIQVSGRSHEGLGIVRGRGCWGGQRGACPGHWALCGHCAVAKCPGHASCWPPSKLSRGRKTAAPHALDRPPASPCRPSRLSPILLAGENSSQVGPIAQGPAAPGLRGSAEQAGRVSEPGKGETGRLQRLSCLGNRTWTGSGCGPLSQQGGPGGGRLPGG